ncbi:alpha/beta fold hydrolase [Actinoallomurus sp. CA-150999]|uniref:alpha/beta fold hydrolase n=1 Tax=Actinoallomurus sp. CA-150999 TaxID=3239887 RepID=UPI003D8DD325
MTSSISYKTDHVISADGTRIGFRTLGNGPGLVLLHGSMQWSGSHLGLAALLADRFTLYLPDRRGRGQSGPYPAADDFGIRTELDDVAAVLEVTGARDLFGVSASGLIALEAARTLPGIRRVAVYEPALVVGGEDLSSWLARYDQEIAAGKVAAALVTAMMGLRLGPPAFFPHGLMTLLTKAVLKSQDKKAAAGEPTMRSLASTLGYEGRLVREMAGTLDHYADLTTEVLLLGGSKGLSWIKPALDALDATIPNSTRVELPGLDHGGTADAGPDGPAGKPAAVAPELRRFFAA